MTYMENIFICMASPLLIAALCMGKRHTGALRTDWRKREERETKRQRG